MCYIDPCLWSLLMNQSSSGTCSCCSNARSCASAPFTWTPRPSGETPHTKTHLVCSIVDLQRYCLKGFLNEKIQGNEPTTVTWGVPTFWGNSMKQPCWNLYALTCALNSSTFMPEVVLLPLLQLHLPPLPSNRDVEGNPNWKVVMVQDPTEMGASFPATNIEAPTSMHLFACTTKFS